MVGNFAQCSTEFRQGRNISAEIGQNRCIARNILPPKQENSAKIIGQNSNFAEFRYWSKQKNLFRSVWSAAAMEALVLSRGAEPAR